MSDLYYAAGDQLPSYTHQMVNAGGTNPDLTGTTVNFIVRKTNRHTGVHTSLITGTATLDPVTRTTGWATYTLSPGDATLLVEDPDSYYEVRWRVMFGTQPASYPNDGWLSLTVS